jgi:ankyrin repeat protein
MMTVVCTKDDSHDLFRLMICNPSPLYLFAIPTGTPLLWCCYRRQGVLAKLLLHNYSANITVRANSGDTPLTASASVGSAGLIQLLMVTARQRLENAENALLAGSEEAEEGKGAVAAAAGIGNLKAFVDAQNTSGYSALLWAADRGHVKAAAALLEGGASLSLTTTDGDTPLHVASNNGRLEMVKFLLSKGADVDQTNRGGDTALHGSAMEGHSKVTALLLRSGAGEEVMNGAGQTAYDLAVYWSTDTVVFVKYRAWRKKENLRLSAMM